VGSVKNFSGSAEISASLAPTVGVRTASTAGLGTRGFFGVIRSFQTQANPLSFSLTTTPKAKSLFDSSVPRRESAIRRTSAWVAKVKTRRA
jgi:hypothetical protein